MKELLKNIANLFKVKTILSLTVIGVTSYMAVTNKVEAATWMAIASSVITYYFNKDVNKTEIVKTEEDAEEVIFTQK